MSKLLLDTNIIIDYLRGYRPARTFLEKLCSTGGLIISVVTRMELYAGKSMDNPEVQAKVDGLLSYFTIIPFSPVLAGRAGELLRHYRTQGLSPLEAIIAATALDSGANLITRNIKHYQAVEGLLAFELPDAE